MSFVENDDIKFQTSLTLCGKVVSHMIATILHALLKIAIELNIVDYRDVGNRHRRGSIICYMV